MSDMSQRERELLTELAALRRRMAREETKEFDSSGGGTAATFLGLSDTPGSYAGAANYFARVNSGGSALVFGTVDWGDIYNKVNAGTSTLGIAAFNNGNFTVSGGTVSLGTIYPRYSGVPTANAMAYWTSNGTLAAATFGTAPFAQYSGTQSAGVFAYFTGTGTVTANGAYGTATMPIYNGTPAANDMAYWDSANRLTNAPFGTADVVRTSGDQTIAGAKTFSGTIKADAGLLLSPGGTHDYLFGDDGADALVLAGQTAAKSFDLRMNAQDADGTDNVILSFWAVGKPGSVDNRERLIFGYLSGSTRFEFQSEAQGTGTLRPIVIYTEGNTNQLYIATNGRVGVGVDPTAKLHVEQTSTTAAIPTLRLKQSDLSEEFIRFESTVSAGNPINTTALGAYYGRVRVYVEGVGAKWLALYN